MRAVFLLIIFMGLGGYLLYDRGYFTSYEKNIIGSWQIDTKEYITNAINKLPIPFHERHRLLTDPKVQQRLTLEANRAMNFTITPKDITIRAQDVPQFTSPYTVLSARKENVTIEYFDRYLERTEKTSFQLLEDGRIKLEHPLLRILGIPGASTFVKQ